MENDSDQFEEDYQFCNHCFDCHRQRFLRQFLPGVRGTDDDDINCWKNYVCINCFLDATILGHRNLPGVRKECPCFSVKEWLEEIKSYFFPYFLFLSSSRSRILLINFRQHEYKQTIVNKKTTSHKKGSISNLLYGKEESYFALVKWIKIKGKPISIFPSLEKENI